MRRLLRACGSLCVLGAMVWAVVWAAGRGSFAEGVDGTVSALRQAGLRVEVGGREIGGFPLGYAATLRNVSISDPVSGALVRLPSLQTGISVTAPDRIVTTLPERFTLDLPVPPALAAQMPDLPGRLVLDIVAEGARVSTIAGADGQGRAELSARSIVAAPAASVSAWDLRVELEDLRARVAGETAAAPGRIDAAMGRSRLRARRIEDGAASEITIGLAALSVEAEARATGRAEAQLQGRDAVLRLVQAGAEAGDGELDLSLAQVTGAMRIAGAEARLEARVEGGAARLVPADRARIAAGGVALRTLAAEARGPVHPTGRLEPLALRLQIAGLDADPALRAALDARGALPDEPLALSLLLTGTAMLDGPLATAAEGTPPRVRLGGLELAEFSLTGLGAAASATGALTVPPLRGPAEGEATVRLSGVLGLIRALSATGLLAETSVQSLATLAAIYTRPGDGPDELRVDLGLGADGVTVNGEPLR